MDAPYKMLMRPCLFHTGGKAYRVPGVLATWAKHATVEELCAARDAIDSEIRAAEEAETAAEQARAEAWADNDRASGGEG